ncbi:MAG: DUF427 domain-containing protein [Acidimicrobiales bacterium]
MIRVEPGLKRVRAYLAGVAVADSRHVVLVWESPRYPTYYFPAEDVRLDLLQASGATRHSPSRGDAVLHTVTVGGRSAPDAAARYPDSPIVELRDLVRLDWSAMDEWLEEDEPVYTHARDPYVRVDVLASSRHVSVVVGGERIADSHQPRLLFETGLVVRHYLPMADVRLDLLRPSDTITHCPYKGAAMYWTAEVGDTIVKDVAWCYRYPLPEAEKVAGLICFYPDRATVTVDGATLG